MDFIDTDIVSMNLFLDKEQIIKNVPEVQNKNHLKLSKTIDGFNFTVEMETGYW